MDEPQIKLTNGDWTKIEMAIKEVLFKHLGEPEDETHPIFGLEEGQFCYTADAACVDTFNYLLKISQGD